MNKDQETKGLETRRHGDLGEEEIIGTKADILYVDPKSSLSFGEGGGRG